MENIHVGGEDGIGEDITSSSWCTVTPQRHRRPLQQLNFPNTASPRPNVSVTPYKYHRCRVIPEESENAENIDPCSIYIKDNILCSKMKTNAPYMENAPKDESSPFAYPLIWESHQVTSSPSLISQRDPVKAKCSLGPTSPTKPETRLVTAQSDAGNIAEPQEHLTCDVSTGMERKIEKGLFDEKENIKEASGEKGPIRNTPSVSSSHHSKSGSSSINSLSNFGPMVTPSKSTPTPPPSDRPIFLTPSERFKRTGDCRGAMTPQQRKHNPVVNPFEVGADCLQLPAVSPSLFRQVVSPSQKVDTNFHWSIDQLAVLKPANIETSPYNQADIYHDPDYEQQAQDAIDRFFSHHSVVPSPWTGGQKSVNLLQMVCTPVNPVSSQPKPRTNTVWCQTELSLPPVLPEAVEEALKPFNTFTQDQWWQGSCEDEGSSLNNTTLRRKLLFSQDELLNATPMCSPRGADTPDPVSSPPSPTGSLLLHEDDEAQIVEEEDHRNLLWCGAIINPGDIGASNRDPQLARHPPPTPPFHMVSASNEPCDGFKDHDHSMLMCSPSLSPVQAIQQSEDKGRSLVASPDVSPIHCHQYANNEIPKDVFISSSHINQEPSINDLVHGQVMSSFTVSSNHAVSCTEMNAKQSPSYTIPFYPGMYANTSTSDQEMTPASPRSNCSQSSVFTMRLQQSLEFAVKCQGPCSIDKSYGNTCNCVKEVKHSTESSQDSAMEGKEFLKEDCSDCLRTTPKIKKVPSPCRIFHSDTCSDMKNVERDSESLHQSDCKQETQEKGQNLNHGSNDIKDDEHKTPVKSSSEQRSTSGHFSSSPIREDGTSPLAVDTPRRRFSSSPPLSPILCRSLMFVPHQENPQKSQLKSHFSMSHTHMSIDIEGKSCTDEELMMEDERISVKPVQHPRTTILRRSSSVCEMETDLNPSLEVNASGEMVSQDTGYQTGSLHTTNFSLSTFGSDSGASTTMSQLKDAHFPNLAKPATLSADTFSSSMK